MGKLVSNLRVINKLTERESKDVLERRASTGSGLLAFLNSGFAQTFRQIVSKGVNSLNNPNLVASRHYNIKGLTSGYHIQILQTGLYTFP